MSNPITFEQTLEYHQGLLLAYGGTPGLRDAGALQSALAQPHLSVFGSERFPDTLSQAAAYLFFVTQAHAFIDGNKRIAGFLCLIWLYQGGYELALEYEGAFFQLAMQVATGKIASPSEVCKQLEGIVQ